MINNNYASTQEQYGEMLQHMCEQYRSGANVDWNKIYHNNKRRRISLPTYRFDNKRCWINLKEESISIFDDLMTSVKNYMETLPEATQAYNRYLDMLKDYFVVLLLKYFQDGKVFISSKESYPVETLKSKLKVIDKYGRLFMALLDILERCDFISCIDGIVYGNEKLDSPQIKEQLLQVGQMRSSLLEMCPQIVDYMRLLEACVNNYKDILSGEVLAANIIFMDNSVNLLENIYKNNEYIEYYHMLTNYVMAKQLELLQNPQVDKTIRIIEIGAGTGGASLGVLNSIAGFHNIEYHYTDLSLALVEYGREHYGGKYNFMQFHRLDIESKLNRQGITAGSYDIVLAYDVLHATKDINATIRQVKKLLRTNGILVVLEPTKAQDYSTITFGTLEGWWLYEDEKLRIKNSPLLTAENWLDILRRNGFNQMQLIEPEGGYEGLIVSESDGIYEIEAEEKSVEKENKRISDIDWNSTQTVVFKAWEQGLGTSDICASDSFYELGGDSIIAMKVVNQINKDLQIGLKINELLGHDTILSLSEYIDSNLLHTTQDRGKESTRRYQILPSIELYDSYCIEKNREYSIFVASPAQKRIYVLSKMEGNQGVTYNLPRVFIVEGEFDIKNTEKAFQKVVNRHEALRTNFISNENEIYQRIYKKVDLKINYSIIFTEKYDEIVQRFVQPFNLDNEMLLRIGITKVGDHKHLLLVDMHHIISDGISINTVINDFKNAYLGLELLPVTAQYRDYVIWQGELAKSIQWKQQEEYWVEQFGTHHEIMTLPTDYPRDSIRSFEGDLYQFEMEKELYQKLKQFSFDTQSTLFSILLSTFYVLISKYSNQEDITVGTVIAGRQNPSFESVVGMFVNTLAMRNRPKKDMRFLDFLKEVKQNSLSSFENQDYQFEQMVEKLNIKRDLSHNPLFDIMFVMQNIGEFTLELEGLNISICELNYRASKFDITLMAVENEEGLLLSFEYCTRLFHKMTIMRMAKHFIQILNNVISNSSSKISEISMMTNDELATITKTYNQSCVIYDKNKTVAMLFEETVNQLGSNIALVYGTHRLSYARLDKITNSLARSLMKKGVTKECIVPIIMERSHRLIIAMLSIMKAGGAYLPIDPDYPRDRIIYMLEDSNAKLIVSETKYIEELQAGISALNIEDDMIYDTDDSTVNNTIEPNDLLYVIYTSGTTGNPKGVLIEHRGIVNLKNHFQRDFRVKSSMRVLIFASPSFDAFESEMYMALLSGAQLHITSKEILMDPKTLNAYLADHKINIITLPPYIADKLELDSSSLELVVTAGSESKKLMADKIGKQIRYINAYGPTEDTVCTTVWEYGQFYSNTIPIGKPIANNRIYIVDDKMELVPIGLQGELCISSDALARGYLNQPELTKEKFVPNPYEAGNIMYRTGDLVRWLEDGNIEYLGRIDQQVKIRGFRIELSEIENSLLKIDGMKEAVVIAREESSGDKFLFAYYISDKKYSASEIRNELKKSLPNYMLPSYYMRVEEIPLTINGKLDKEKLPMIQEDVIDSQEEAESDIEILLLQICRDILQTSKLGVSDNLFDNGVDSFKVIEIITQMRKMELDIEISNFFRHPTVRELVAYVVQLKLDVEDNQEEILLYDNNFDYDSEQKNHHVLEKISRMNRELHKDIQQQKAVKLFKILPIQYEYVDKTEITGSVVEIAKTISKEDIRDAVRQLIQKHELLRSGLKKINQQYFWEVLEAGKELSIPFVDLSHIPDSERIVLKEKIIEIIFDGSKWYDSALYNMMIIQEDVKRYSFIMAINHIIFDGISNDIIRADILNLCTPDNHEHLDENNSSYHFSDYAAQIQKGPFDTNDNQIIQQFQLEEYALNTGFIQNKLYTLIHKDQKAAIYRIVLDRNKDANQFAMAFDMIYQITSRYYEISKIPVLMLYRGREYMGKKYFEVIGNCIDVLPVFLDGKSDIEKLQNQILYLNKHNINFAYLRQRSEKQDKFKKVSDIIFKVMESSSIIVNYQGAVGSIPDVLEKDNRYVDLPIARNNMMFIIRHDSSKVELTMTLPYSYDSEEIHALLKKLKE